MKNMIWIKKQVYTNFIFFSGLFLVIVLVYIVLP